MHKIVSNCGCHVHPALVVQVELLAAVLLSPLPEPVLPDLPGHSLPIPVHVLGAACPFPISVQLGRVDCSNLSIKHNDVVIEFGQL